MTDSVSPVKSRGAHRIGQPKGDASTLRRGARLRRHLLGWPAIVDSGTGVRAEVALSFDDGPSRWSAEIATALERYGCRATFFVCGPAAEKLPDELIALAHSGHEIGNHLWTHTDAGTQSRAQIRAEIKRTGATIRAITGKRARLVRPPYGKAPEAVVDAARWTGITAVVQRTIGSGDWEARAPSDVVKPVLECAMAGDIVGLHDGVSPDERDSNSRDVTVEAVKQLVPGLLERGLQPVTVSQLLSPRADNGG